jgi:tRNA pseudouridine55 synthase
VGTFAFSTDTGDEQGKLLLKSKSEEMPTLDKIAATAQGLVGEYLQRPPYFSAVKHEGRPLYEWAREGVFIDKPAVKRHLYSFEVGQGPNLQSGEYEFHCEVSSGTYIRGLWSDLAKSLAKEGHLKQLKRQGWGRFNAKDAMTLPINTIGLEDLKRPDEFWDIPKIILEDQESVRFCQGQYLEGNSFEGEFCWVYDNHSHLLGLGGSPASGKGQRLLKTIVSLTD